MNTKKLASVIVSSLIMSSLAATPVLGASIVTTSAAATTSNVKLSFPDVTQDYWGIRHISKLALEGIIDGFEDGTYRSENSVTQQDVLIMAVRMMGLQSEVDSTATTVFPEFLQVSDYARKYVEVARQKGLISYEEEKARTNGVKQTEIWGQQKATREWVAEVVIRAIGKASMAEGLSGTSSAFKDNNEISPSTLGYVNAAVALKIVDGFEDGSFQPKGAVTRAQMATFLSRSQKELATLPGHAVKGYLTNLTSGTISIMDDLGNTSTYKLSSNTTFYGNKNDKAIQPKELQETYQVTLVPVNGTAYYVEINSDELHMDIHEGQLLNLNMSTFKATLDDYNAYDLAQDVTVTDSEGRGLSLADVVAGSTVQLRKSQLVDSDKYTSIVVKQIPINKTSTGDIQMIDAASRQVTLVDASTGEAESFTLSSTLVATLADNSLVDLTALHVGDTVEYTVKNSVVVKVTVKKQADVGITVEGTIKQLSDDKSAILINKASGIAAYELNNNVRVAINGLLNAGIYDLAPGDTVKLDVLNNKVTLITVTSRSIENLYFAKIDSYNPTSKLLVVVDNTGMPHAYSLTDTVSVSYGGNTLPFSNFTSMFTAGKYVDLQASKNNVMKITMSTQVTGTLTQLNLTTNDITLKTDSGQNLSFKLAYTPVVELANKANSALSDLKIGDIVSLQLSYDQSIVLKIVTSKTALYKTAVVNASAKTITVTDAANTASTVSLDGVPIVKADQTAGAISDLLPDDYVKLSFEGLSLKKAEIVTPIRGKVTAVNAATGSLTIQDFSGKTQVVSVGTNYEVKLGSGTPWSLTSMKVDDRVQVMKDASDKFIVQVAIAASREVDNYNSIVNQLYFKATSAGDRTSYSLFPRAYYHQGTTLLTPASFTAGNVVKIYVLDDKIVEIEK
ncbi:S-layer homology domain-containing protein [Paenibacillus ferrarius]|uniref:S-layer homology domain-containing protein n=1 Tax=Paenibacillus ferrarius TaxID=1469647 RepID=UPI003D2E5FAE